MHHSRPWTTIKYGSGQKKTTAQCWPVFTLSDTCWNTLGAQQPTVRSREQNFHPKRQKHKHAPAGTVFFPLRGRIEVWSLRTNSMQLDAGRSVDREPRLRRKRDGDATEKTEMGEN